MTPKNPAELAIRKLDEQWRGGLQWAVTAFDRQTMIDRISSLCERMITERDGSLEAAQPQGEDCSHAWPNMNASTSRKCMSCGVSEQDVINAKMEETGRKISEAFHTPPTDERRAKAFAVLDKIDRVVGGALIDRKTGEQFSVIELDEVRAALQQPAGDGQDNEWFFRWAARATGGHSSYETAIGMIFNHPDNPYLKNNPWQTHQPPKDAR